MAMNVFGNPITDETLKAMPKYHRKRITRCDRAREALILTQTEKRDKNAVTYLENLKKQYGNGVSKLCLFYNATGDPITVQCSHDWHGHVWKVPYPATIGNGQWGAFLHVHSGWATAGSSGCLIFRGKNDAGKDHDFLFSWMSPWWPGGCKAYTMVREAGYFDSITWAALGDKLTENGNLRDSSEYGGCKSYATIGNNTTAFYEAKLTLKCAE